MTNNNDFVDDDETLYRRIPSRQRAEISPCYEYREDGTIRIYSTAFSSRDFKISVDRAKLHSYDPRKAQKDERDGVVSLFAREVRDIVGLGGKIADGNEVQFKIDVRPDPLPNNNAHAEIYAVPEFDKDSRKYFRLLRERFALIAEKRWEILPDTCEK